MRQTQDWTNVDQSLWAARPAELHQVGPHHAITDYFRRLHASSTAQLDAKGGWLRRLEQRTRTPLGASIREDVLSIITECSSARTIMSIRERAGRRLGIPVTELAVLRTDHGEMRNVDMGANRTDEAMFVSREYITIGHDQIDVVLSPPFTAFTRHALERIHEREHCDTGGIDEEIRRRTDLTDRFMTFALSSGLSIQTDAHGTGDFPTLLLPFGDGLIVVASVLSFSASSRQAVVERVRMKRGFSTIRSMSLPIAMRATDVATPPGVRCTVINVSRTYISPQMLYPEQIEYRDAFLREAAAYDLGTLAENAYRPLYEHEPNMFEEPTVSDELRSLLTRVLKPHPMPMNWSIGRTDRWMAHRNRAFGLD